MVKQTKQKSKVAKAVTSAIPTRTRQKLLRDAKKLRQSLIREAQKYERAKVTGRTKEFYKRAAELVREEAAKYTQAEVKNVLRAINRGEQTGDVAADILEKLDLQKTFNKGKWAENVARRVLSSRGDSTEQLTQAGARFYAGLISVWNVGETETERKAAYSQRDKLILEAFGKKNLLEVMEQIENELGINLIDMLHNPEKYDEAVNAIQSYVAENVER